MSDPIIEETETILPDGEVTNNEGGDDSADVAPTQPEKVEKPAEITPEDVASRLEGNDVAGKKEIADEGQVSAEKSNGVDLSLFTPEQLQRLKMMLNSTPDRPTKKADGISIKLREYVIEDRSYILKDLGKAFNGYMPDPEEPTRKISTLKIKVQFFGMPEPMEMKYEDFMQLPRKEFKVKKVRVETDEVEEGTTTSNETGQLVTMIATYQTRFFTIELPNGETVEVSDKQANA